MICLDLTRQDLQNKHFAPRVKNRLKKKIILLRTVLISHFAIITKHKYLDILLYYMILFQQISIPFTQGYFLPRLVEIDHDVC